jgi:hypothetical protein
MMRINFLSHNRLIKDQLKLGFTSSLVVKVEEEVFMGNMYSLIIERE